MKTNKELIELLLKKVKKDFNFLGIPTDNARGICLSIALLFEETTISFTEKLTLSQLVKEAGEKYEYDKPLYWWTVGRKRPRVKFLKRMLEDLI